MELEHGPVEMSVINEQSVARVSPALQAFIKLVALIVRFTSAILNLDLFVFNLGRAAELGERETTCTMVMRTCRSMLYLLVSSDDVDRGPCWFETISLFLA